MEYSLRDLLANKVLLTAGSAHGWIRFPCPYLNCAYKLREYAGRPRRKRSRSKATWPGRKTNEVDTSNRIKSDVLTRWIEKSCPREPC